MSTISAGAVGLVAIVTTRLGSAPRPAAQSAPTEAPLPEVLPQAAPAVAQSLVLNPRSAWGAAEPLVSATGRGEYGYYDAAANPNGWMVYSQPIEEVLETIIIHHSALPLSEGPREIQRLHQEEKGFADVGYQYILDEGGNLYEGRPLNVRGAHTYAFNYGSVGICLMGNFEEIPVPEVQLAALRLLLADLHARFPRIVRLAGHKDFNPGRTLCPGVNLSALLPDLAAGMNVAYSTGT